MEFEEEQLNAPEHLWQAIPSDLEISGTKTAFSKTKAQLWGLVLESRFVPYALEPLDGLWKLNVPVGYFNEALNEIRQYEEKNRNWPPSEPVYHPEAENRLATISILILLATFHNLTQLDTPLFGHIPPDWIDLGKTNALKIPAGQWWRIITALTLHADWLHLFSNLTIGGFFVYFLCRDLGSGLAWSLLLSAGMLGNWVNAFIHPPTHSSVGASTAVFGAVGILAAINLIRLRHHRKKRWAMPVAAALGLLALLGVEGKNTDLGAHLFGFIFGICLGLIAEYLVGRRGRPGPFLNALLALACAGIVVTAWWAALTLH